MGFPNYDANRYKVVPKDAIVLDLDVIADHLTPGARVEYVLKALRAHEPANYFTSNKRLAEAIEAQTKPPRIPEPGPWGVVKARPDSGGVPTSLQSWVRTRQGWSNGHVTLNWSRLIDPVLVRPGVDEVEHDASCKHD